MTLPKLLLLSAGETYEEISRDHGDFDLWFQTLLAGQAELQDVKVFKGEAIPDVRSFDGLIISGSPASVTQWEGWMEDTVKSVHHAADLGMPVLGVCFGHQLLGKAFGGRVEPNPAGREIGTVEVVMTKPGSTDPVLGPLFPTFKAQATHVDTVLEPPPQAEVLARTAQDGCAAMRIGKHIYGVQFHPELNAEIMRRYIHKRGSVIDSERGLGAWKKLHRNVAETRSGETILRRFVHEVVLPRRSAPKMRPRKNTATALSDGAFREQQASAPDGQPLFYNVVGKGAPTLMMFDGIGCDQYAWKHLVQHARHRHRIIRWNYPGHGRSPAPLNWLTQPSARLTVAGLADDAIRVMDHAGVERAVLCGHSMGVQVALETWHRHKDRVSGLVLVCGSFGRPLSTFHGHGAMEVALPYLRRLFHKRPGITRAVWRRLLDTELAYRVAILTGEVNGSLIQRADFFPYFTHISQVDPLLFVEMLGHASRHSAREYLGQVDVPSLIVAGERDTFTPAWLSQEMHHAIPNSEMLMVPTGSHTAPIEIPELVNLRVEKFLATHLGGHPAPARQPQVLEMTR